jgi:hypothetical protein
VDNRLSAMLLDGRLGPGQHVTVARADDALAFNVRESVQADRDQADRDQSEGDQAQVPLQAGGQSDQEAAARPA